MEYDGRHDAAVHGFFQLSRSNYLVLPRSLMQAMPIEWQDRIVDCLNEMAEACRPLNLNDNYIVTLRDHGRIVNDPYAEYRRPLITKLPL